MKDGTRAYVPVTLTGLRALSAAPGLAGVPAFAVTDRLAAELGPLARGHGAGDVADELAEAALLAAADAALELIAADPAAPPCRVVVAADVPVRAASGDAHPAAVECTRPVRRADVASVLLDDRAAAAAVARAAAALRAGDDAAFEAARDDLDGLALSWYDAREVDGLVAASPAPPGEPLAGSSPTRDRMEGRHP
ncbi:MAG: hypothetical protein ACFCVF_02540 [Kineosporiaceae bacterium]